MRTIILLALLVGLTGAEQTRAADPPNAVTPILIELFTSEGCSSCPPADTWLQQLEHSQPIPGAQAIVLSEHVDYWNHDGWKDPYSLSLLTDRQSAYVRVLRLSTAYTPQVIVSGKDELQLNDPQQVSQVLLKAAKAPQIPVSIGAISVEGNSPAVLRAHIEADGTSERRNAEIYAAVALDHAESQVLRGENGGRRLTHTGVVEELIKIGKVERGKVFSQEFHASIKPGVDPNNLRLVVFVQEPDFGSVLGAAVKEIGPAGK